MTVANSELIPDGRGVLAELPLWRLNLMRVGYAVMGSVSPW
jgi:hypothetical protein